MNSDIYIKLFSFTFLKKVIYILPFNLRLKFIIIAILLVLLSILDLITIAFIVPLVSQFLNISGVVLSFFYNFFPKIFFLLNSSEKLIFLLITFISLFFLKNILSLYVIYLKHSFIFKAYESVGNNLFLSYLYRKYNFFLNTNSSILIRNIQTETLLYSRVLTFISSMFQDLIVLIFIIILLFYIDVKSTLIILLSVLVVALIFILLVNNKLKIWSLLRIKFDGLKIKTLQESFQGIKDVKLFNAEDFFYKQFKYSNYNSSKNLKKERVLGEIPKSIFEILLVLCLGLVTIFYLEKGYGSAQTIIYLSLYFFAGIRIIPAVNRFVIAIQSIKFCIPSVEIIYGDLKKNYEDLFDLNQKKKSIPEENIKFKEKINLDNISFKYPGNKSYIFKNLNLEIEKFDFVGIYGDSGSGKTTLLNILTGLLSPNTGSIAVDHVKLPKQNNILLKLISYVPQNFYLVDESIKKNIIFNTKNNFILTQKLLTKVISQSKLSQFIKKLPQGLSTKVGENSSRFSGGQRQRLAIARALFKNTQILIMDEPTSSLDKSTENKLVKEIKQLSKSVTIIIISHNLKVLKNCNNIYELKNKRLVKKNFSNVRN